MAAGTTRLTVTGAKELQKALRQMAVDMSDMKAVNTKIAEMVAAEARGTIKGGATKTRAWVKAGNNRKKKKLKRGGYSQGAVPYAGPIHFGWPARHIRPQPFLYDAIDSRAGEVVDVYKKRVAELVQRVETDTRIKQLVRR
jgi:creatinine amidohydrolase/Fe(II)-dependent formamide hydrolase-like protein